MRLTPRFEVGTEGCVVGPIRARSRTRARWSTACSAAGLAPSASATSRGSMAAAQVNPADRRWWGGSAAMAATMRARPSSATRPAPAPGASRASAGASSAGSGEARSGSRGRSRRARAAAERRRSRAALRAIRPSHASKAEGSRRLRTSTSRKAVQSASCSASSASCQAPTAAASRSSSTPRRGTTRRSKASGSPRIALCTSRIRSGGVRTPPLGRRGLGRPADGFAEVRPKTCAGRGRGCGRRGTSGHPLIPRRRTVTKTCGSGGAASAPGNPLPPGCSRRLRPPPGPRGPGRAGRACRPEPEAGDKAAAC